MSRDYWLVRGMKINLEQPRIMGILNLTPDSFSDGGDYFDPAKAVDHVLKMAEDGADIIDVGAESTRPGSRPVSLAEELGRLMPVLEKIIPAVEIPISVDTRKAAVAEKALSIGCSIVNDISGGQDERLLKAAGRCGAGLVLMHMQGTPQNMQDNPVYDDVMAEIRGFLSTRLRQAAIFGVSEERIVIDPGIGFGKNLEHNLTVLARINELAKFSAPVMIGPSRKKFIGQITGAPVRERLAGTIAAVLSAYFSGIRIFRVHDVRQVRQALMVAEAIKNAYPGN